MRDGLLLCAVAVRLWIFGRGGGVSGAFCGLVGSILIAADLHKALTALVNLDAVDDLNYAVHHHAPSQYQQRCGGDEVRLENRQQAYEQDDGRKQPPEKAYMGKAGGNGEVEELVDGT